jgi:hypothetical protein
MALTELEKHQSRKFVTRSVLTEAAVREMRALYDQGHTIAELATMFAVTYNTAARVVHRQSWAWVTQDTPLPGTSPDDAEASLAKLLVQMSTNTLPANIPLTNKVRHYMGQAPLKGTKEE